MANFMPGEMGGLPVEYFPQMQDISRQLKMADILRQQAQAPQGQMVSGHYVAPSITQYLAQGLNAYTAKKKEDEAASKQNEIYQNYSQSMNDAITGLQNEMGADPVQNRGAILSYLLKTNPQKAGDVVSGWANSMTPKQSEPYYQYVDTPDGLLKVDARGINPPELVTNQQTGMPFVKSASSPNLQGTIASEKARGGAEWKPNTDIPGTITTDANVVRDVNNGMPTNNFNTPYPVTFGAPGTTATDRNEGIFGASDIRVGSPARPSRRGIQVPTDAQLAGAKTKAVEEAKAAVEMATKPQIEAATVTAKSAAESQAKKDSTMSGIGSIIDEARGLLKGKTKPTSSMVGSLADTLGGVVGIAVPGSAEADQLKAIGGALVAKMPRMEGPQSNFDVQSYQRMAGDIGNDKLPIARRLKALESVEKLWRKYDKTEAKAAPTIPSMDAIQAELARRRGGK